MPPKKKVKKGPVRFYLDLSPTNAFLELRKVEGKGMGVFTKQELPANTRIVYEGDEIGEKKFKEAEDKHEDTHIVGIKTGVYIDANPKLAPKGTIWWASFMNEPDSKQTANCVMAIETKPTRRMAFVTVKPVPRNTELTVKYGNSYRRIGYRAGKAAPKPAWL